MGLKILTVDDSKTIRLIISKAFKAFDCEVLEACNGVEGLALASRAKPDLIILDLTMPVMDGYETLSRLKADPELKAIPVVMLTAEAGRDNVLRIAKQGVRDYLVKPFKEEMIIERAGRIIDLKPKGAALPKNKRYDDPLLILVVDDKPAIAEQIRQGLADTPWTVVPRPTAGDALDYCSQNLPDAILASVSLPDNTALSLVHILRANPRTKSVPVFAMCVKTAVDEQNPFQQSGFTGLVTKPIDFADLKARLSRALSLDTSYKYFQEKEEVLLLTLPAHFNSGVANEISLQFRAKFAQAVDAGLDKMLLDLSQIRSADIILIKLVLEVMHLCDELSIKRRIIGSEYICRECANFEETKEWRFVSSFEEAVAALHGKEMAAS